MERNLNLGAISSEFKYWEKVKDIIDQLIDIMLNYRQSGHPGGSRSKVHALVALTLSGAMRWDIRYPWKTYSDRFILAAGHTIPLVYAMLATYNEALRAKYEKSGKKEFSFPFDGKFALLPEHLLGFRNNGGLPGHAEMAGKTLFLKWNTGPSGHGSAALVGEAFALKYAGADSVLVWGIEGEGGLTPGVNHEAMNSAWGLGLNNLCLLVDWNDYGIDDRKTSSVVYGTPYDWFSSHGWKVWGTENGMDFAEVTKVILNMASYNNPKGEPRCGYLKTRKGRGYYKYDNKSHGAPHKMNSELFWKTKKDFMDKYNVVFDGYGEGAPSTKEKIMEQYKNNINIVMNVLREDKELVDYLSEKLVEIGESVPKKIDKVWVDFSKNPLKDPKIYDYKNYPKEIFKKPGEKAPNRKGLFAFGSWINKYCHEKYGRPLFIVCSADLADSTNISGFAKPFGDFEGWGWYNKNTNLKGCLLPQEITEFLNAGLMTSMATVNFAENPFEEFNGFLGAASTYGSFSYLKYGMVRLFSQLAQDCDLKVGKFLWVAGHSGPETAEDSRTHFGVFAPGVTQLLPRTQVINLYPWEYNEVPVVIGAALKEKEPVIALHLTRPPIEIPDREKLGIASYFEAAKGAYLIRDFEEGKPKHGVVIVQGTSTTNNIVKILDDIKKAGLNVKIIAAISYELFKKQPQEYQNKILPFNEWMDSMVITNQAIKTMYDWISNKVSEEYSMSSDWDNRWRTGGSVEEVVREAHLSPEHLLEGIEKFAKDREKRLSRIKNIL